MTSRERVRAAFAHRRPDRTPIFEYVLLPPIGGEILGHGFMEYMEGAQPWVVSAAERGFEKALRSYARDRVELAGTLGHDMIYVSPNPVPGSRHSYDPLDALGTGFAVRHEGDPVERLSARNALEAQAMSEPQPMDSFLVYHFVREELARRDLDLPILAPAYYHGIWTDSDLMQVMLIEPDVAREHFALATRKAFGLISQYAALGVEMVGVGGDFAGSRLLVSPESYRSFIVPEVRACAEQVRANGQLSVNASDGDLWPVIKDFLEGCGVDGYLEIDMGAGMDLRRLKEEWGSRFTFLGNMDCGRILSFASPEEVRLVTLDILEAGLGSGHIFTASNAITASVPLGNYLAMVAAYRDRFGLPALKVPSSSA